MNTQIHTNITVHQYNPGIPVIPVVQPTFYQAPPAQVSPAYVSPAYVPVTPQPQLTQAMHNETLKLLSRADDMSYTILYGKKNPSPVYHPQVIHPVPVAAPQPAPVNINFVDHSFKMFNNETHVEHHHYHGNDKKNDNGTRMLVGIIGLVVGGIAAFCIGKAMAEGEEVQEENISFAVLKDRWNVNKAFYDYDYQTTADEIVRRADSILQREQTNRTHKIALLVFSFIAGGTAVAGALIGSTAVMTVAAAIGACVIFAGLFKLGYTCFSRRDQKDAVAIDFGLEQLRQKTVIVVG